MNVLRSQMAPFCPSEREHGRPRLHRVLHSGLTTCRLAASGAKGFAIPHAAPRRSSAAAAGYAASRK